MTPSPWNERALNAPKGDSARKGPRFKDIRPRPSHKDDTFYPHMHDPPGPMEHDLRVAHQAQPAPEPSHLHSQQRRSGATSQCPGASTYEGCAARADTYSSTSGWNRDHSIRSESPLGAGHTTSHVGGSVEAQWALTHSPIIFRPRWSRFTSELQEPLLYISAHLRGLNCADESQDGPIPLSSNNTPIPLISQSLRLWRAYQATIQHGHTLDTLSSSGEDRPSSDTSWLESPLQFERGGVQLMNMSHTDMSSVSSLSLGSHTTDAQRPVHKLGRPTCSADQISTTIRIPDDNSPRSPSCNNASSSPSSALTAMPSSRSQLMAGSSWLSFPELMADTNASYWPPTSSDGLSSSSPAHMWIQPDPINENTRYSAASTSSKSHLPPPTVSSRSRFHPVHPARAPMGTVSEATVLWLVRNIPPTLVSGLLPEALSLEDPETQLSVLVVRDVLGRRRVTAAEVNEFEATVYDESMDERQRGRRQRKPRRRSNN
ncbi:hypothetical protein BJ912DRAFT_1056321 [Pholiota molesta]|nr:hypothetical protein BJ912DRAFT_1056321 [Pholiota molesta]